MELIDHSVVKNLTEMVRTSNMSKLQLTSIHFAGNTTACDPTWVFAEYFWLPQDASSHFVSDRRNLS